MATHFNTVILSADSRQCYKELNVGVARPTQKELQLIPHHFIASHSVRDDITAAWYQNYALNLLQQLFATNDVIVVTGGTGLYIKALTLGLDAIPEVPGDIRNTIIKNYEARGIEWLQEQLQQQDPLFSAHGEMQNPQRMMRALEVLQATGQSILRFRNKEKVPRPFNIVQVGLELSRDILYERINSRVDAMMAAGLEKEVRSLLPYRHLNALQTVGYKELFEYLDGTINLQTAVTLIKQNTRRYAKRQMTWFKKQAGMAWVDVQHTTSIVPIVENLLLKNK